MMFGWFRRKPEPAVVVGEPPRRVPQEVVAAIEAAWVSVRGEPDPEDGAVRLLVRVPGVGHFIWDGLADAADRLARNFELAEPVARRAAKLLAAVVAREEREARRARHAAMRATSWVHNW